MVGKAIVADTTTPFRYDDYVMLRRLSPLVLACSIVLPGVAGVVVPADSTWRFSKGTLGSVLA